MRNITINPDIPATVPDSSLSPVTLTSPPSYWTEANKAAITAQVTAENEGIKWDFVPEPDPIVPPDWDGFLTPFYAPGVGNIYDSIATPVQLSTPKTQEHWANFRMGLINPIVRNPQWCFSCWEYLKYLLALDGNALSEETIAAWQSIANTYHIF